MWWLWVLKLKLWVVPPVNHVTKFVLPRQDLAGHKLSMHITKNMSILCICYLSCLPLFEVFVRQRDVLPCCNQSTQEENLLQTMLQPVVFTLDFRPWKRMRQRTCFWKLSSHRLAVFFACGSGAEYNAVSASSTWGMVAFIVKETLLYQSPVWKQHFTCILRQWHLYETLFYCQTGRFAYFRLVLTIVLLQSVISILLLSLLKGVDWMSCYSTITPDFLNTTHSRHFPLSSSLSYS